MRLQTAETAPAEGNGKRRALLICNGTFPKIPRPPLPGPARDASNLAAALGNPESCRFEVRTLLDEGLLDIRREIARICAESAPEDTVLIYYSGSGQLGEAQSLYLTVADSELEYIDATALDAEFILAQLRRSRCEKIVLLIDACHSGAFFNNNRGIPHGLYAITSCGARETSADSDDGGIFTLAVCEGLRGSSADADGDGRVSIDELHDFVKGRMRPGGGVPQKWVWNVPAPIYLTSVQRPVFLSYAREDLAEADRLGEALKREGLAIWIDREGIKSGNWKQRVTDGLNRARALVVLLTHNSLRSDAVEKELGFAATKKVPIIPVTLGELKARALPDWFKFDYGDLHRHVLVPDGYAEAVRDVADAIRKLRNRSSPLRTPAASRKSRPSPGSA